MKTRSIPIQLPHEARHSPARWHCAIALADHGRRPRTRIDRAQKVAYSVHALIWLIVWLFTVNIVRAQSGEEVDAVKIARVKAAFLYNFAKFVHWPDSSFAAPDSPIVIGVFGRDPFGDILDSAVRGRTIGKRRVTVVRMTVDSRDWRKDIRACHILYVADPESNRTVPLWAFVKNLPILLVGESEQFARNWGMIGFSLEQGRVVLNINRGASSNAGLNLGADLIQVGRLVD